MKPIGFFPGLSRTLLWMVCAVTSFYSLLCYLPFTWTNFIADARYPEWVALFLRVEGGLIGFLAVMGAASLWSSRSRALAWGAPHLLLGVVLMIWPMPTWITNSLVAFWISLAAWLPLVSWELMRPSGLRPSPWPDPRNFHEGRLYAAAISAAIFSALVYAMLIIYGGPVQIQIGPQILMGMGWSLAAHLCVFGVLAAIASALNYLIGAFWRSRGGFPAGMILAAGLFLYAVLDRVFLSGLSVSSGPGRLYALVVTASTLVAVYGYARDQIYPVNWGYRLILVLGLLFAGPFMVQRWVAPLDWNQLIQTLSVYAEWALSFAFFYSAFQGRRFVRNRYVGWVLAALVGCAAGLQWGLASRDAPLRLKGRSLYDAVDRWTRLHLSSRAAQRFFTFGGCDRELYQYLHEHTNVPRSRAMRPVSLSPVAKLSPTSVKKPLIFIFVIDSLRQDYLGSYNPAVTFTPAFDALGKDGLVFRRAFTVYGGTGLSEPSIWAGAMLPHQQYPHPFAPLNALEKLLTVDGYARWVTMDVVLSEILSPSPKDQPLDTGTSGTYKFCDTLTELEQRIPKLKDSNSPIFVYTQPQDIHVSVINREGAKAVDTGLYKGFYAPYASRVARMDACFSRFVQKLKEAGLYDESLIIVTADHGDSLGEDWRWGHAYTIFPEIMRIPLILHLPLSSRSAWTVDVEAPARLIDLAPTLYAFLGHGPLLASDIGGKSLLSRPEENPRVFPLEQLVVSSYGPVYGLLEEGGNKLYIADGVNFTSYYFDLLRDPAGQHNLASAPVMSEKNRELRTRLETLVTFYGL